MDAPGLHADKAELEKDRAEEALAADGDEAAVRKLVGLLLVGALRGFVHLGVEIQRQPDEVSAKRRRDVPRGDVSGASQDAKN